MKYIATFELGDKLPLDAWIRATKPGEPENIYTLSAKSLERMQKSEFETMLQQEIKELEEKENDKVND